MSQADTGSRAHTFINKKSGDFDKGSLQINGKIMKNRVILADRTVHLRLVDGEKLVKTQCTVYICWNDNNIIDWLPKIELAVILRLQMMK